MKKYNKILSLFIIVLMLMSFTACGKSNNDLGDNNQGNQTSQSDQINDDNADSTDQGDSNEENNNQEETDLAAKLIKEHKMRLESKLAAAKHVDVDYPIRIETLTGEVVIEEEPEKIVSLGPNITEALYAIGAGDKLVGRTSYCDYPEEVEAVDMIGTLMEPNIELIVELQPDIVIASTHFPEEALKKLNDAGIKTIILYVEENFDGVYSIINTLGTITNHEGESNAVVESMKETISDVQDKLESVTGRPSVYYVVGYGEYGEFTATGETFINDLLEMAGGDNIAKEASEWKYNVESLVEKDPEIIILSEYNYEGFISTKPYSNLSAVKNNKVYRVDENIINRQGPRLVEGLIQFATIIQPDMFQ